MTKIRANIYTLEKSLMLEFTFLNEKILNTDFMIETGNYFFYKKDIFDLTIITIEDEEYFHMTLPSKERFKEPTLFNFNSNIKRDEFKQTLLLCLKTFCHLDYFNQDYNKIIGDKHETYEFK